MNLILNLIQAVSLAGLAEGMALADRASISQKDLLEILGMSQLSSPILVQKGEGIADSNFMNFIILNLSFIVNSYDEQQLPNKSSIETYSKRFKYDY